MIADTYPFQSLRPLTSQFTSSVAAGSSPSATQLCQRSFELGDSLLRLQHSFINTGGLVTSEELVSLLRVHCDQPISALARWIVDRRTVSFEAGHERWFPLFQFDTGTMQLRSGVGQAIDELRAVFDDGELAEWFATANSWLGNASPASLVATQHAAVLEAARADRFVAAG